MTRSEVMSGLRRAAKAQSCWKARSSRAMSGIRSLRRGLMDLGFEKSTNHKLIKERDCVKKGVILKVISIVFVLITILAIACAITVTGSGFLDLSNIVKAVCIGVAVICGILAFITWKYSKSKA